MVEIFTQNFFLEKDHANLMCSQVQSLTVQEDKEKAVEIALEYLDKCRVRAYLRISSPLRPLGYTNSRSGSIALCSLFIEAEKEKSLKHYKHDSLIRKQAADSGVSSPQKTEA